MIMFFIFFVAIQINRYFIIFIGLHLFCYQ